MNDESVLNPTLTLHGWGVEKYEELRNSKEREEKAPYQRWSLVLLSKKREDWVYE